MKKMQDSFSGNFSSQFKIKKMLVLAKVRALDQNTKIPGRFSRGAGRGRAKNLNFGIIVGTNCHLFFC